MMLVTGVREPSNVAATRSALMPLGHRIRMRVLLRLFQIVMRDLAQSGSGPLA
jgi:hypothetical protein